MSWGALHTHEAVCGVQREPETLVDEKLPLKLLMLYGVVGKLALLTNAHVGPPLNSRYPRMYCWDGENVPDDGNCWTLVTQPLAAVRSPLRMVIGISALAPVITPVLSLNTLYCTNSWQTRLWPGDNDARVASRFV